MNTTISLEDRKENLRKLKEFHKGTLDQLGVANPYLMGKMAYLHNGQKVISLFYSEISQKKDLFVEFTDRYNVPEYEDRTLYKWRFNPHFEEEYLKVDTGDPAKTRYLIPVDELQVIKKYEATTGTLDFSLPDPEVDPPINDLTIRDLAAILLQKPVSKKDWLNEIIKNK
jgi:hypothetical protein